MAAPGSLSRPLLVGATAGVVATGTMTSVLFAARQIGALRREPGMDLGGQEPVQPSRLTARQRVIAVATHVGIGCAAGATFALSRERLIPASLSGPSAGAIHGLAVWAIGYLGVLPGLGVLPPPYKDDARRAAAVLAAHLAYGATVGTLVDIALARTAG